MMEKEIMRGDEEGENWEGWMDKERNLSTNTTIRKEDERDRLWKL